MQSRQGGWLGSDLRIQERQWKENGGAGIRVIGLQLFHLGKISLDCAVMEQGFLPAWSCFRAGFALQKLSKFGKFGARKQGKPPVPILAACTCLQ